jgi:transcriptional regulator with XRE-family HTH domain
MARIGGKPRPSDLSAGQIFAKRLAEVRKARGWSQKELAERMTELGHRIHRVRLAKIEKERARAVTLEDVLALSYALDVSPLYMVTPIAPPSDPAEPETRLLIAGERQPAEADDARAWLRGEEPLLNQDPYVFTFERPARDIPAALERHPEVTQQLQRSVRYPKEEQ